MYTVSCHFHQKPVSGVTPLIASSSPEVQVVTSALEDLVNPIEECEVGDSPYRIEGGDAEIVAEVQHEMVVAQGEIIELDDEDDDKDDDNSNFLLH